MAWSVPAVAVVTAAPAFATSRECLPVVTYGDDACKCPGQSSSGDAFTYYLQFCVNDSACTANNAGTYVITKVEKSNGSVLTPGNNVCYPATVPTPSTVLGSCGTQVLRYTSTNSANKLLVYITITSNEGSSRNVVVEVPTPPRDCAVTPNCPKC